jgi:4-amino-4-deoxy-L-arabinose transferase-like glycosyltransferase
MGWRPRAAAWAAVIIAAGFAAAEATVLFAPIRDYDEGVYWQSFRALLRGEPLFSSVFAPTPPAFYGVLVPFYWLAHSLTSLRIGVLVFGVLGLAATYVAGRLLVNDLAALIGMLLAATSPLYLHQSAVLQADGPAVAMSVVAVALALLAVRSDGRVRDALAAAAGLAVAVSVGIKLLGVLGAVPVLILLLASRRARGRLLLFSVIGGLVGSIALLLPVLAAPSAALNDLVFSHLRAGQAVTTGPTSNLKLLLLNSELPLEALALVGAAIALLRRARGVIPLLAWLGMSLAAVTLYQPLFPHHLVMLTPPLALLAAVGLTPHPDPPSQGGREIASRRTIRMVVGGLVLATATVGAYVDVKDIRAALVPDPHAAAVTAVRAASQPGEFWITDDPSVVAAADRDVPGPLVDASYQRTAARLLTVGDLEAARIRYNVRWVLIDSGRLDAVPGFRDWLNAHFHTVQSAGGAVIYRTTEF